MSEHVISLSSDDEESPKKNLVVLKLPLSEVSLSVVPKSQKLETVSLDSDEEVTSKKIQPRNLKDVVDLCQEEVDDSLKLSTSKEEVNEENENINKEKEKNEDVSVIIDEESGCVEINNSLQKTKKCTRATLNGKVGNNCIIIDDSGDEKQNQNQDFSDNIKIPTSPGPSNENFLETKRLYKQFLKATEEKLVGSVYADILPNKIPIIEKYFRKNASFLDNKEFQLLLSESMEALNKVPTWKVANKAILNFHKIYRYLKNNVEESTIEVEQSSLSKIKRLEEIMSLLTRRLKQLDESEVDFDDDANSNYMIQERFTRKLNKVYLKYCKLTKKNPHSGRATHDKIQFVSSNYHPINLALTRKYRNSLHFPSYYELKKYIEKTVKKENLPLTEQEIARESEKCFKSLGNILQRKRQQELYNGHLLYIEGTQDPATDDLALENTLKKNYVEGKERIDKICEKYVMKQKQGEDYVSPEENNLNSSSSEEEEETNVTKRIKLDDKTADNLEILATKINSDLDVEANVIIE